MGYRVYSTEGLILSSVNLGEANKLVIIFSQKFGLISVLAQGLRAGKSKLRSLVQPMTLSEVSLIRGREFWRLIGADQLDDLKKIKDDKEKKKVSGQIFNLLLRLINGEEKNEELYQTLKDGFGFLTIVEEDDDRHFLINWESLMVLRILKHLGYKITDDQLDIFLQDDNWSQETLSSFSQHRLRANQVINFLLKHSHL